MAVPENIGCNNDTCVQSEECNRAKIAKESKAVEIKSFGGGPDKGCGKFIPIKKD